MKIERKEYESTHRFWRAAIQRQRGVALSNLPYNATKATFEAFLEQVLDFLETCVVHWLTEVREAMGSGSEHREKCYLLLKNGDKRRSAMDAVEGKTFRDRSIRVTTMARWPSGLAPDPASPGQSTGASTTSGPAAGTSPAAVSWPTPIVRTEIQQAIADIEAQEASLEEQLRLLGMKKAKL